MKKIVPSDAVLLPKQAKKIFQGEIFSVHQWPQKLYDGSTATFEMLKRPDTVAVLAVVDDKLLVLDEEQPNRGARMSWPGGRVDPSDASTLEAAKREMLEETGYAFKQWKLVLVQQLITKIEWFIFTYIAWDVQDKVEPHLDAGEKIVVQSLPFPEVQKLSVDRVGYLGEASELLKKINSLEELLQLTEFTGQVADR